MRTAGELLDIYLDAVGANASLLLNIPPDTHGRIAAPDCAALRSWVLKSARFLPTA